MNKPFTLSARLPASRPVLANTTALMLLRGSNLAVRLGLLFLIARVVQPAEFGRLVLALSAAEVGKVLADFGMDTLAIREYALSADRATVSAFAGSFAGCRVLCAALVQSGLIGWVLLTQPRSLTAVGIVLSFTVWTSVLQGFSLDWFQGRLRVSRVLWRVLTVNVLGGLAAAFVVSRAPGLEAKALALPALELLVGSVLLLALRNEEAWAIGRPSAARMRELLRASVPIAVTGILIMLYSRLDVFVMAGRLPAVDLGRYGIAMRFTEPFQMVAVVFGLSVYSRFTAWFTSPEAQSETLASGTLGPSVVRYALGTLAYGVTVATGLATVGPLAVERFLPAYIAAVPLMRILAGALVFRSLNATMAGIIQASGSFRALALLAAWNLVLVFVLLLLLVPWAGAEGAALALLFGEGINSAFQLVWVTRIVSRRERAAAHGN